MCKIILAWKNEIINKETEKSEKFSTFFIVIVSTLNIAYHMKIFQILLLIIIS